MTRWFGPLSACAVALLGCAAAVRADGRQGGVEALRSLGTLLTVITGLFSAVWWHQSATLPDQPGRSDQQRVHDQRHANMLNGAAATTTGLALIGSVYSGLTWFSPEGAFAALAFLLLLAMSGDELWQAAEVSLRHGLRPRSTLAIGVLVIAGIMFIVRCLVL